MQQLVNSSGFIGDLPGIYQMSEQEIDKHLEEIFSRYNELK